MKKLILFCSASLLVSIPLFAQESKSDLMKQVAKETCVELSNNDFSKMNSDQVKITMGVSMIKVVARHLTEFESFGGVNLSDPQSVEKLAFEVGVLLAGDCPGLVAAVTANPNAFNEVGAGASTGSISGKLLKIVGGDFTYLQVKDEKGKTDKLWWIEYFDGANKLGIHPENQVNKNINVRYVEKEVFNFVLQDYVKIKVISSIELR